MTYHLVSEPNITAVVLVGGFGTRIRHITGAIPKPLVQVNEKPFLHWLFRNLRQHKVNEIYLLSHFGADLIEDFAQSETGSSFKITCIRESMPAGTGGSVLEFLSSCPDVSDPFLVLNGDSILVNFNVSLGIERLKQGYSAVIFGVSMNDTSRYGTLKYDENMSLISFEEKKPGSGTINSGVYLFSSDFYEIRSNRIQPLSMERDVIPAMLESGKKICVISEISPFIDIGTEESLAEATSFIRQYFQNN